MNSPIDKVIIEPLREVARKLVAFLPSLLTGLVVFAAGLLLAWLVKLLIVRVLKLFKLDAAFSRAGVTEALQKMTVKDTPAKLIGRTFYWLVTIIFFILALKVMKVPVIDKLLEGLLLFLPNILVAVIIVILGWMLSNFLGRAALIASVNSGVKVAGQISRAVKGLVLIFAFVMAFEQVSIGRHTLFAAFAIAFGGAVLALALAFGLGGKDLARKFLEKRFKKDGEDAKSDDLKHI